MCVCSNICYDYTYKLILICISDTESWEKVNRKYKVAKLTSDIDTVPEEDDMDQDGERQRKRTRR